MSAAFEHYLQPPAPDPEHAPDDTTEPVGPAVEDIDEYQQPPPSMLRPAHEWEGNASRGPRPWVSRPAGHAIAGFSLSAAGHVLTWTAIALSIRWWLPTLALAAVSIVAGIVVSATALARHRRGTAGGSGWAGVGLAFGILWVLLAVAFLLLFLAMGPSADY
jgi:hypothetical protein